VRVCRIATQCSYYRSRFQNRTIVVVPRLHKCSYKESSASVEVTSSGGLNEIKTKHSVDFKMPTTVLRSRSTSIAQGLRRATSVSPEGEILLFFSTMNIIFYRHARLNCWRKYKWLGSLHLNGSGTFSTERSTSYKSELYEFPIGVSSS
jgi:hypothetical protein